MTGAPVVGARHEYLITSTSYPMNNITKISLLLLAIGFFTWLVFGFFGIQALFTNKEVTEDIPDAVTELISEPVTEASSSVEKSSKLLGSGSFVQGDSTYTISGNAFLSRINDKLNLTFTDFEVSNGPDLFVYAVKTDSTENSELKATVASGRFIKLSALKGNLGDQNYLLDAEFETKQYQVISIWCRRFSRNFGSVYLVPPAKE